MKQIKFPDEYGYFWDIARIIKSGGNLPIDEINLVGGRKSGKTTTVELFSAILCLSNLENVGIIGLRNSVDDSKELLNDFCETFDAYDINYKLKKSDKLIKLNKTNIRIAGVNNNRVGNKAKKSGLTKFGGAKYIIIFFEERFEFDEVDVLALIESIRGISSDEDEKVQILVVNACNPWAKSSPYITYCGKHQTWNTNILKTKGSQISQTNVKYTETINGEDVEFTKRAIFHYTNWRVAKRYLGDSEIKNILGTWNTDKKRAATTDWGLPGYEDGAIYTHLLNNLGKAVYQEHSHLMGGGDYGWGRDSRSGKTVFHFCGWTENVGIDCYNEYVTDNHKQVKSPDKVAEEVCKFYYDAMVDYCNRIGWASAFNLSVRVDNMSVGIIQILNNTAKKYKMNWIKFIKCKKFPINDRIEITTSLMYRHQLRLGENVKLLKSEMELAYYVDGPIQKRAKENDHSINGFEYCIEPVMYKIAKNNGLTKLAYKGVNNGR